MSAIVLPAELVLGDFTDAIEALRASLAAAGDAMADGPTDTAEPLLDASAVRRIDGAGLQWLLAALGGTAPTAGAARLRSSPTVDEALRLAGVGTAVLERRTS